MNNKSKVVVLMATYNGIPWIAEQVSSILNQSDVEVELVISDDCSSDNTKAWLESLAKDDSRVILLPNLDRVSSAGKNFYRLIVDANINNCDYVAFADQDDIWLQDKLISHLKIIKEHQADGVSSNVIAFWCDGKEKLIIKSQPQKKWDYLFESAGPGCTFLMTPWLINKVRLQLKGENSVAKDLALHDWLTYAVCRAHGRKWVIDNAPSVMYRQHQNNVVGANSGFKAKLVRLKKLKKNWYRGEVIKICEVSASISESIEISRLLVILRKKNIASQFKFLPYAMQLRRKFTDSFLLIISIVLFVF